MIENIFRKLNSIDKIQIEAVLDLAEFFGMVAPIIEKESFQINDDNGEMTYAVHRWEDEWKKFH